MIMTNKKKQMNEKIKKVKKIKKEKKQNSVVNKVLYSIYLLKLFYLLLINNMFGNKLLIKNTVSKCNYCFLINYSTNIILYSYNLI